MGDTRDEDGPSASPKGLVKPGDGTCAIGEHAEEAVVNQNEAIQTPPENVAAAPDVPITQSNGDDPEAPLSEDVAKGEQDKSEAIQTPPEHVAAAPDVPTTQAIGDNPDAPLIEDVAEGEQDSSSEDDRAFRPTLRPGPVTVTSEASEATKSMDNAGRQHILALHAKGKNPMQIKNNFLLADYDVTEESIREIIREGGAFSPAKRASESSASNTASVDEEDSEHKTYSLQELKEWTTSVKNNDMSRMRELLAAHPSLLNSKQPGIGNSAMHWAAAKDYTFQLKFLINSNANLSVRSASAATPLHSAAMHGNIGALTALLEAGADMDMRDENGETPREAALRCRESRVRGLSLSLHVCGHTHVMATWSTRETERGREDRERAVHANTLSTPNALPEQRMPTPRLPSSACKTAICAYIRF